MGNYQLRSQILSRGQSCVIVDIPYTESDGIPKNIYYQGTKVEVVVTKDLYCSRPNAPKVTCSKVKFPNGKEDVYFTTSLKPVQ